MSQNLRTPPGHCKSFVDAAPSRAGSVPTVMRALVLASALLACAPPSTSEADLAPRFLTSFEASGAFDVEAPRARWPTGETER